MSLDRRAPLRRHRRFRVGAPRRRGSIFAVDVVARVVAREDRSRRGLVDRRAVRPGVHRGRRAVLGAGSVVDVEPSEGGARRRFALPRTRGGGRRPHARGDLVGPVRDEQEDGAHDDADGRRDVPALLARAFGQREEAHDRPCDERHEDEDLFEENVLDLLVEFEEEGDGDDDETGDPDLGDRRLVDLVDDRVGETVAVAPAPSSGLERERVGEAGPRKLGVPLEEEERGTPRKGRLEGVAGPVEGLPDLGDGRVRQERYPDVDDEDDDGLDEEVVEDQGKRDGPEPELRLRPSKLGPRREQVVGEVRDDAEHADPRGDKGQRGRRFRRTRELPLESGCGARHDGVLCPGEQL